MGELIDKAKGKAKQAEADLTGDKALHREGVADEVKGNIKGVVHKVEDAAKNIAEKVKDVFKK
ncbi:MAG: CsbD family protein [Myxococcales bacterium]